MIDTLMAIAGGIILYSQSSFLFAIAFIMVIAYAIIVFSFNKPIRNINRVQMENNAQLTSYLVESLNGIETVKTFNAERKANIETEKKFVKLLKSIFKGGWINNLETSLTGFVASVGGIVILWVGAYSVIKGDMSVGQLLAFNALLAYFLDPIKNLINLQPMMQTAIVASDRLGEILDLELEKSEAEDKKIAPKTLKGLIEFKELDFRYGTRQLVLKNINLKINSGEKIAFVGESGSGKTTLVKLLLNLYKWEKGEILINGYNVKDINMNYLRERIAYISQDIFLFSGTIYENLTLGIENPDMETVIESAKMAKAHDFGQRQFQRVSKFIEGKLKLKINKEKTSITRLNQIKYLGYGFYRIKGKCRFRVHPKSITKLKDKLRETTGRSNGMSIEGRKTKLNQIIRGWVRYFKLADMKAIMQSIDEWLRRRIRMIIMIPEIKTDKTAKIS